MLASEASCNSTLTALPASACTVEAASCALPPGSRHCRCHSSRFLALASSSRFISFRTLPLHSVTSRVSGMKVHTVTSTMAAVHGSSRSAINTQAVSTSMAWGTTLNRKTCSSAMQ